MRILKGPLAIPVDAMVLGASPDQDVEKFNLTTGLNDTNYQTQDVKFSDTWRKQK